MPRLAIFVPFFHNGGVERMMVNLSRGIAATSAVNVDLLVCDRQSTFLDELPPNTRVIEIGSRNNRDIVDFLADYLQRERPEALLSAKDECNILVARVKRRANDNSRWFIRAVVNVSQQLGHRSWLKKFWAFRQMRRVYRQADGIIAVSNGVAHDIERITGVSRERIHVAPNPVILPELAQKAAELVDHPWLIDKSLPVVIGGGRLGRQKNFALLIRAFALANRQRPARLIILGEGRQRQRLLKLAADLGIAEHVSLPGFNANPYALLARADLFVLSSRWEGSPNILTEAMALGTAVVATDCPSGPRELLDNGRLAPLVPMDDAEAMAAAIVDMLAHPTPPQQLAAAVSRYTIANSSRTYLDAMGLDAIHTQ
jgi:glycosyltransferase involved in cell wall biosynthesis